jgi:hypothetical protein
MGLDIRIPIGVMFGILGLIITIFGALSAKSDIYAKHSLGINVNLWWGLVMIAFAVVMLVLAGMKKKTPAPSGPAETSPRRGH